MTLDEFLARRMSPFIWDDNSKQARDTPPDVLESQRNRSLRAASRCIQAISDWHRQNSDNQVGG
jgi:hypothetical protein